MSTEIHVYTSGEDPFETDLLGIHLIVHAGSPPAADPPPEEPKKSKVSDIVVPTVPGSPYRDLRVHDLDDPEKVRRLLGGVKSGTDLRLRFAFGADDRVRLDRLISGLEDSELTGVRVHVVPDDSDGAGQHRSERCTGPDPRVGEVVDGFCRCRGSCARRGTQLSSIGSLAWGSTRFGAVAVGGVLAIAGVGAVLWAAIAALTAPAVGLKGLVSADPPDGVKGALEDPYLLAGRANAGALAADYSTAITARGDALREHYADPDDDRLRTAAKIADAEVVHLDGIVGTLLDVTAYQALACQWRRSRTMIVAGAAAAAIGISMIAWGANPPAGSAGTTVSPGVLSAPRPATLGLSEAGQDALRTKLGADCPVAEELDAMVLEETGAGADVVVTNEGCEPTRFVLVPSWGTVG